MWHPCSMMSHWLLSPSRTENRSKQHGLQIYSASEGLCSWQPCTARASLGESIQTGRSMLQAPRAPTLLQDITTHFPKFPQGNKDRLTYTHKHQHEVALTWKPLGTQQSAVQKTHSFMHWAVGVGAGSRGLEEVGGHSPPCPSKSPVSTGEGTGDTAYIG